MNVCEVAVAWCYGWATVEWHAAEIEEVSAVAAPTAHLAGKAVLAVWLAVAGPRSP